MIFPNFRLSLPTCIGFALFSLVAGGCASTEKPRASVRVQSAPAPAPRPTEPPVSRDAQVQLQLFLDDQDFGPGVVDGRRGEFTSKALQRYNASRGLASDALPDVSAIQPYRTYQITANNVSRIGVMAAKLEDLARQERQTYTSLTELLGERFHTTQDFIRRLNPGVSVDALRAGDSVTVPNLTRPFAIEDMPSAKELAGRSALSARRVTVDLAAKFLEIRDGEKLVAAFPITPGSSAHPAPPGEWRITGIVPFPWFRYDGGVLNRGERTDKFYNLPPGPNGPVGILWAGLNKPGIGIHGSPNPETIGRAGSHGCIRLSNWDASKFCRLVGAGAGVTIR